MWEKLKFSFKDKRFRLQAISIVVVAFLVVVFVFWFSAVVSAVNVSGFSYSVRFQNGYGGSFYPSTASAGFLCNTGDFYQFYQFKVQTDDGSSITFQNPRYLDFVFDFSELNLSYEYDITFFGLLNRSVSFDGFLTTAHTFSNSDVTATFSRSRYNGVIFKETSVFIPSPSVSEGIFYYWSTSLNSHISNNQLSVSMTTSVDSSTLSSASFGFLISVSGSDFQQLLYRSGAITDSADYLQLIDDTRSALASGDISSDQASIILDNASDSQSQLQVTHITEAQNAMDSIIDRFINSSSGLSGEALADLYTRYNGMLYDVVLSYTGIILDPSEGSALADLYSVASDRLKSAYQNIVNINFFNSLSSVDDTYQSYSDTHDYIIDKVSSVNLSNSLQITTWADTLTESEKTSFKSLLNSFISNFSWSIFIQVPLYLTLIITLLGTSRSKEE